MSDYNKDITLLNYVCNHCQDDTHNFRGLCDECFEKKIQAINDHLNAINDLLATTKELDKTFITAILRHIKGFKATLRKEILK